MKSSSKHPERIGQGMACVRGRLIICPDCGEISRESATMWRLEGFIECPACAVGSPAGQWVQHATIKEASA